MRNILFAVALSLIGCSTTQVSTYHLSDVDMQDGVGTTRRGEFAFPLDNDSFYDKSETSFIGTEIDLFYYMQTFQKLEITEKDGKVNLRVLGNPTGPGAMANFKPLSGMKFVKTTTDKGILQIDAQYHCYDRDLVKFPKYYITYEKENK